MAPSEDRKHKSREPGGARGDEKVVIKKYANRRLYNTATSSYVTLDHLCQMVKDDIDFVVYDAKTGEDITRPVLTQIIVEEESKGANLLPINFLRQLIGFYGDSMQFMVPRYLEHMMSTFAANQERIRQSMQETMGSMFPFGNLEEVGRQNVAMMEQAMKMFAPFAAGGERGGKRGEAARRPDAKEAVTQEAEQSLEQLQRQVEKLRGELSEMSQKAEQAAKQTARKSGGRAGKTAKPGKTAAKPTAGGAKATKTKTSGGGKPSGRKTAGGGN